VPAGGIQLTNFEVGNTSKPVTSSRTPKSDWHFFLRAGKSLAGHIEKVVVKLHPTFTPGEYTLTKADADGAFTTPEVRGWGVFPLQVEVHWKACSNVTCLDGGKRSPPLKLSHMLALAHPAAPKRIDLSHLFLRKATKAEAMAAAATAEAEKVKKDKKRKKEKEAAKREVNKILPDRTFTMLYYCAYQGDKVEVEKLLAKGADPSIADTSDGSTPLYMATQNGFHEIVQALLAANASPTTAVATHGQTPVYVAAQCGHCDILKTLLDAGASPATPRTVDGATPLRIAQQNCDTACVALLTSYL
jgi:transcription initiation factor IIF auxiliary subunit